MGFAQLLPAHLQNERFLLSTALHWAVGVLASALALHKAAGGRSPPGSSALGTRGTIPNALSEKSKSPTGCRKTEATSVFKNPEPGLVPEQMGPKSDPAIGGGEIPQEPRFLGTYVYLLSFPQ